MPGSVLPLAMFFFKNRLLTLAKEGGIDIRQVDALNKFYPEMFRFLLLLGLGVATEWFSILSMLQQTKKIKKSKRAKEPFSKKIF